MSLDAGQAAVENMQALEKLCAGAAMCARHGFAHAFEFAGRSWSGAERPSGAARRPRLRYAGTCRAAAHRRSSNAGSMRCNSLSGRSAPRQADIYFFFVRAMCYGLSKVPTPYVRSWVIIILGFIIHYQSKNVEASKMDRRIPPGAPLRRGGDFRSGRGASPPQSTRL